MANLEKQSKSKKQDKKAKGGMNAAVASTEKIRTWVSLPGPLICLD
jgi:hypothetical protein